MLEPVIVGGDPKRRGLGASASYEVRPFGIHAGMPLSKKKVNSFFGGIQGIL